MHENSRSLSKIFLLELEALVLVNLKIRGFWNMMPCRFELRVHKISKDPGNAPQYPARQEVYKGKSMFITHK
jgi:hypothetical protein